MVPHQAIFPVLQNKLFGRRHSSHCCKLGTRSMEVDDIGKNFLPHQIYAGIQGSFVRGVIFGHDA